MCNIERDIGCSDLKKETDFGSRSLHVPPAYLASVSKAVHAGIKSADENAIWLMQGWLFLSPYWTTNRTKALLTAVPKGEMLILDLASETCPQFQRFESYFGQPFIWCMLHDFGGTVGMYGAIESVNKVSTSNTFYM